MSCCDPIPGDAVILSRNSNEHKIVYRTGETVTKMLRPNTDAKEFSKKQALAAAYPEIFVPFEFDNKKKVVHQPFRGNAPGTPADVKELKRLIQRAGLFIGDVIEENIRGGRLIDFTIMSEDVANPIPRGIQRIGKTVKMNSLTVEEAKSLGKLLRWPT